MTPTPAKNPIGMFLGDLLQITQELPPGEGSVFLPFLNPGDIMATKSAKDPNVLIYVITDGCGNYKVGHTAPDTLKERIQGLQAGNAFRLREVHTRTCPESLASHIETMVREVLPTTYRVRPAWFRGKQAQIIGAVDDCTDRALSMDDAIEDLIEISEFHDEMKRAPKTIRTDIENAMAEDIERGARNSGRSRGCLPGIFNK